MSGALRGYVPILATPFDAEQEVDLESLRRLVDHLVACGTDGLVTLANASEGYLLSADERRRVAEIVLDRVAGRVPVVVSITTFAAKVAADEARWAEGAGAAAVLSMPPFYGQWRTDRAGMREFFATVADRSSLPIVLQDHALSGYTLTTEEGGQANLKYFRTLQSRLEDFDGEGATIGDQVIEPLKHFRLRHASRTGVNRFGRFVARWKIFEVID